MKVLWFSNTAALGGDIINKGNRIKGTGGWMYALNVALQKKVELSLTFHYAYNKPNFAYQNTNYYPIYTGNIVLENFKKRFLGKVYDEDFLDQYLEIINEVKPDIIHIHGTENSFLSILGKVDIPVVISIQGNLNVYHHKFFSGYHGGYLKLKDNKITLKSVLFGRYNFNKGYKTMQGMVAVEKKQLKIAENIIGRTQWDRRITRVLAPNSKYYIGNEMLRQGFYTNEWNNSYKSGTIKLFTTNGNNYYKGFETLCYALHLLTGIGVEVEWHVAGIKKDSLINKITRKQLQAKYPEKGLVLLGSLDEDELIHELKNSHIYIMPSHIENSPNNLCEAMMLGMPCIATYAGGTGSMLEDGKEGILIQDGDPWAMAGAIIELATDPGKVLVYGKAARLKALKRHDKDTIISNLIETYSNIIGKE
jgi:glycosyltransferase involved in cell wall biosynthesis